MICTCFNITSSLTLIFGLSLLFWMLKIASSLGVFELPRGEESSSYQLANEISSELIEFGCACEEI